MISGAIQLYMEADKFCKVCVTHFFRQWLRAVEFQQRSGVTEFCCSVVIPVSEYVPHLPRIVDIVDKRMEFITALPYLCQ
jgi:hypothetical protein